MYLLFFYNGKPGGRFHISSINVNKNSVTFRGHDLNAVRMYAGYMKRLSETPTFKTSVAQTINEVSRGLM